MVDCHSNVDGWEGSYTVLMWCSWFNILADIAFDLRKIEKKLDKIN